KGAIGTLLWNTSFTPPLTVIPDVVQGAIFSGGMMALPSAGVDPEDGVFLISQTMTRQWWAYSLSTGQQLWASAPENPWNYYGMSFDIYNGMLISTGSGMSGNPMIAYNIKTGAILWTYTPAQVGFESPYGDYPISISCIADGQIFLYSREHHQIGDIWRGGYWRDVNASNGQEIWKLESWGSEQELSDGYLVGWNGYDNQIYCMGLGPSKTTLAPVTQSVTQGSSIELQGTVSDQSYGAPTAAAKQGLQFAAAVSDQDQAAYMQFLYEQQAFPTNAVGVKVHLTAFDPNNNTEDLGYVTSDVNGLFNLQWTPPVPGQYKVTASFEGSAAYGPSMATCAVGVDAAPAAKASPAPIITPAPTQPAVVTPTPAQSTAPTLAPTPSQVVVPPTSAVPTMTYLTIGAVVIIIIAVAAALALRRRK
ncbi:MAG TPA: PQQ-binding-like beta-propeller repeat protein, partial [Candidatus Nanoarchaeia archaeon]|nr:PQQ-binding-like beta-propeller repeat protein [Candidatus Nanoarchaeia archaeon]